MKHVGVILFSYFLSTFLFILPCVIYEGVSSRDSFYDGIGAFFISSIIGFPLISIFMTVHHFSLYWIQKKGWFQLNFIKRILIGTYLSVIYLAVVLFNGYFDTEPFWIILVFAYLAFIYEIACNLMKRLNWWTLFNQ